MLCAGFVCRLYSLELRGTNISFDENISSFLVFLAFYFSQTMFSLLKLKHTKKLIVVKSTSLIKKKKDYLIKLDNGKRWVGIFLCKSGK